MAARVATLVRGRVPTTPDPNTSAKALRCKWEPYRDTNWWCIHYFLPKVLGSGVDFYTPPVLGGGALLTIQRQRRQKKNLGS